MPIDIQVYTETFLGNEDRRWLGVRMGTTEMRSITLNLATFTAAHVINGAIPSGVALGKITATGLWGPYEAAAGDGRQLVVNVGLLYNSIPVGHPDLQGIDFSNAGPAGTALFWGPGIVKTGFLPTSGLFGGSLKGVADATFKAALPMIRWE